MLALYFGSWTYWETYNPPYSFGPQKVVFDGPNKLILVNEGVTELDFREDVYSAWKEWLVDPNQENARYPLAISVVGGDPLPGSRSLGTTFFLDNGWRMRTWEGNHELTVTGNFFTREGETAFVPTLNPWTITINLNTATIVEALEPETSVSTNDVNTIAAAVWNKLLANHITSGTFGKAINDALVSILASETELAGISNTVESIDTNVQNIPVVSANQIANAVWSSTVAGFANNTAGQKVDMLLKLAEADEQLTSNTATKLDKDTGDVLLIKTVSGVPDSNTTITITSP